MAEMTKKTDNQATAKKKLRFTFTRRWFAAPYVVFILVFVLFPMLLLVFRAFMASGTSSFTLANFGRFFGGADFVTFLQSVLVALVSTILCLLIAYPLAFLMARTTLFKNPFVLILFFILPMWINFLLRVMAMKEVLEWFNVPLGWGTVIMGMVYDFLPFMILPVYNSLSKMDKSYLEAAADLGANKTQVFFKTVVPLSMPGVMAGITMVFVPIMSAYAVSDALSGELKRTIGKVFYETLNDGGYLAAMSLIMSIFIVIVIFASSRYDRIGGETAGGIL